MGSVHIVPIGTENVLDFTVPVGIKKLEQNNSGGSRNPAQPP
jgi:hypothetical protein